MSMKQMKMTFLLAMAAACGLDLHASRLEVSQDRENALYAAGEKATFTIRALDDAGALLKAGEVKWTLDEFGPEAISSGTADLAKGNPFTVSGTLAKPGFLRLTAKETTNSVVWAVGFDVTKITQAERCPADFDTYWTGEKARLEREVPLDAKCVRDAKLSTDVFDCYRVNFATFNGKRVYGFMCVPKDKANAPFRVRVSVPGAGPGVVRESTDAHTISLSMNVHMFEPYPTHEEQKAAMTETNKLLAAAAGFNKNRDPYPSFIGIEGERGDYYFHDVMLGINRAIDWVCAREDADLGRVVYTGSSQGGGFGLYLNYLNSHFTRAYIAVAAMTGHYAHKEGRISGWPRFIQCQPTEEERAAAERNAAYYDGVNFASRITHPMRFIVGFADVTCPPHDVYAAFNACPAVDKKIVNAIGSSHNWYAWYDKNKGKPGWINFNAWLDESPRRIDYVDPFIGTEYSGNLFPGPSRPFALVQPSPDSGHGSGKYAAGYKRLEETIFGFSQTHLSGMGCGDLGDVRLLPYVGNGPVGTNDFYGAKDRFRETAKVGYYSVALTNFGVTAEVAASHRVGFHRWTYPKGETPKALVDLQWGCYDVGPAPQLRGEGDPQVRYVLDYAGKLGDDKRTITGHRSTDGWMRGRTVAWHLEFSRPWTKATWEDDPAGGKAGRYLLEFAEDAAPLECRVAISTCDEAGAKRNFDAEAGVSFDKAIADTQDAWEKLLSRATFHAKDQNKLRILYTGLYHADLQPINLADVDGRYRGGDLKIAKSTNADGSYYSNFSTWDTFRSVQAMYALLVPERVNGMVGSMLAHYKAVGCLPIHSDFGIENCCMVAVHSVPIITESYLKGFRGYDAELALEAMTNSLDVLHAGYPREDWDLLDKYGYIPFDKVFNQSASRTLEVAYDDACIAKMARAMGKGAVADFFGRRSYAWTNLFDSSVGFIRGKDTKGNWRHPFDPDQTGYVSRPQFDFTEGSSWTYTWHVMQNPELLIEMLGGKEAAGDKLEEFFTKPGRYDHGNEPGHHIIYLFQYAGRPWMAEKTLRRISSTYHYATDDGITGNDDCGQVSCWYMFTAMGFYPVDPSSCDYVIGAPQIDHAELKLANGKMFTMVAHGLSERAKYVKSVKLNGKPLDGFLLKHADILAGGTLEFEMSEFPSGGIPKIANEQLPVETWPNPLRVQPEPYDFLPCFKDWMNKPVNLARWEEIVRKWTHDAFEASIYGVRPVQRPKDLSFEIVGTDETAVPGAVRKTVRITYGGPCGSDSFEATAFIPKSAKPVGAFLLICNRDPKENLDVSRVKKTEFWPVEEIVKRGYAAVAFHNEQLCPDRPDYAFDQKVHRVYSPQGRSARSWGAISAWAWGASRVLDWLETLPEIDATQVAVVGHSRGGKTSLWAAADDTRFAMACVNDSGCGGAKMNRIKLPDSEDIALVNIVNPHWFTVGWQRMNGREDEFGLDAHDLCALVAPRLLAIGSASWDYHAGPVGEFAAAKYGSLAWEKFGLKGIRDRSFPATNSVVACGNVSYHLRDGEHNLKLWDWNRYMDFADAHGWHRAVPQEAKRDRVFVPTGRTGKDIQKAIDEATAAGGGRVALEKGEYLSGTIYLKSNVELHIPEGCVLKGYDKWDMYDDVDDPRIQKVPEFSKKAFVACIFQDNVAITGGGVIDGQGVRFYHEMSGIFFKKPPHPRPRMIEFVGCHNVRFEDITFKDSPGWTCWIRMCEDFAADRVKIHGDQRMINNDGFHMDGCKRMRIRHCDLKTGDDSIIMRAIISPNGDSGVCEDLLVEDCTLDSMCQAVRLGCPSDGIIRNAIFRNCKMSGRNGIASQHPIRYLQEGDSGNMSMGNILFENCQLDCRLAALCFWVNEGVQLKSFGNVTFRNVEIHSLGPLMLKGCEGCPLKNLRFENVRAYVEAKEPVEMQHVEGMTFENSSFSSWSGTHWFDAFNKTGCWEQVR